MTSQTSTEYEKYYVPEKSKMAVCATIGLILSIFGAASIMNDMTFGDPGEATNSWTIFMLGMFFFVATLFGWFRISHQGKHRGHEQRPAEKVLCAGHVLVHFFRGDVFLCLLRRAVLRAHPGRPLAGGRR